ncbi:glucose-6-phosphate dehydrogenase assembly protein OpcA [Corynebacterium bovis]|uniref:glucose-6-phosphate dehydrogenase assembly protein OpcA n=1 Tax=Corynebacterium bovis TaxID=36808 RepID=UPI000F645E97|nr:glucose-6-phosphate dehydrogenase assembly protein OpcA [Corynebacterium bovis]RRQ12795.1 oxppcycle protein OpcA [Corynebacterium bovis]
MIIDLPTTDTQTIGRRLRHLREERGEVASGRVLTLIIVATGGDDLERILTAANDASREHPARVVVVVTHPDGGDPTLDGQIRLAGDAGASEIIVMHLHGELASHVASVVTPFLLPDTPVVAWWPSAAPRNPAGDPVGRLAQRRITDSGASDDPEELFRRRTTYTDGDSDLAWSRITAWGGLVASALDQEPYENVTSVTLSGPADDPSVDIAGGWLADRLGVPVTRHVSGETPTARTDAARAWSATGGAVRDTAPEAADGADAPDEPPAVGIREVHLARPTAPVTVTVEAPTTLRVASGTGRENVVALHHRSTGDLLAEELRHLDPDHTFGHALHGLVRVVRPDHRGGHRSATGGTVPPGAPTAGAADGAVDDREVSQR